MLVKLAIYINNLGWQSSTLPPWFETTVWQAKKQLHSLILYDLTYKSQQRANKLTNHSSKW
jgi:hypothetical protein